LVKNYNIVGKDFRQDLSEKYDLSILIGMDRFFYAVIANGQVIAMRTHYFPNHNYLQLDTALKGTFQFDKLLKLKYRKTRIGLISPIATLIPADLYDANKTRFYLEQNAILQKEHIVLADSLESIKAYQVYAFHENLFEVLQEQFQGAVFCNVLSALIKTHRKYGKPESIYVNLTGTYMQIVVFNREKLLFSNTFTHRSESDVLYFISLVINQLDLDVAKTKVVLSGEITNTALTYFTLQKYIPHLEFVQESALYKFNHATPPAYHHFFDLMCVSRFD